MLSHRMANLSLIHPLGTKISVEARKMVGQLILNIGRDIGSEKAEIAAPRRLARRHRSTLRRHGSGRRFERERHGLSEACPGGGLVAQLPAAGRGQGIEPSTPVVLGQTPVGLD